MKTFLMFFSSFCSFIVFKVSGRCYRLYRWRSGFVTHPTCFLYTFLLLVINYHLSILCFSFLYFVHVMNREYYRLRGLFNGWSFVPFFFGTRVICNLVSPVAFVLLFFFFLNSCIRLHSFLMSNVFFPSYYSQHEHIY